MPLNFQAILHPPEDVVDQIARLAPENPFYANEYVRVREMLGAKPCALVLFDNDYPIAGCTAFLGAGRVNTRLEITSFPSLPDEDWFWQGLLNFCSSERVSIIDVQTFGSLEAKIPTSPTPVYVTKRSEFRLDLDVPDLWKTVNRRCRRFISKARGAGLILRRANDDVARRTHLDLANLSLSRRRMRGDTIDYDTQIENVNAFIDCNAGEILQAVAGEEVFSSLLIAKSKTGAYGQTSGTSDAGREIGASHFIFFETACLLKSEGFKIFNLGGADESNTGLQEFKLGLGAERVELESAEFHVGNIFQRFAMKAARLIKRSY